MSDKPCDYLMRLQIPQEDDAIVTSPENLLPVGTQGQIMNAVRRRSCQASIGFSISRSQTWISPLESPVMILPSRVNRPAQTALLCGKVRSSLWNFVSQSRALLSVLVVRM